MAISVSALSTIFAVNALAAEAGVSQPWGQLPLKAPTRVSAFDWTGFYVGGHVGYARGNARVKIVDDDLDSFRSSIGSLTGGLQGGYNYVLPSRFVLGVEADMSFMNYLSADDAAWFRTTPDTDLVEKIDYMGTLRGRFGYAFDHSMVYATGGFAWSLNPRTAAYAEAHTGAPVHRVNAHTLALEGHRYDAVVLTDVLEHIPEPRRLLAALAGLLEPDGVIAVKVPNGSAQWRKERWLARLTSHV